MTDSMSEEGKKKAFDALDRLYEENGEALQKLAEIEMEEYTDEQIKEWIEND